MYNNGKYHGEYELYFTDEVLFQYYINDKLLSFNDIIEIFIKDLSSYLISDIIKIIVSYLFTLN